MCTDIDMCKDMCTNMCLDIDMCTNMCLDIDMWYRHVYRHIDMCTDMCINMGTVSLSLPLHSTASGPQSVSRAFFCNDISGIPTYLLSQHIQYMNL